MAATVYRKPIDLTNRPPKHLIGYLLCGFCGSAPAVVEIATPIFASWKGRDEGRYSDIPYDPGRFLAARSY